MLALGVIAAPTLVRADPPPSENAAPKETATGQPLSLLDAVRTTLRLQPAIQNAGAVLRERAGDVDVARGVFDPLLKSNVSHTHDDTPLLSGERAVPDERSLVTDTTDLTVGASMTTTWGTTIAPTVGLSRVHQRSAVVVPGLLSDPVQRAHVDLTLTQPLLRGAGTVGAASALAAARLARDAQAHTVEATAQEQVYLTLLAYFELVGAGQDLELLKGAQTAARKVVEDTKALVEGQQRPKSDLRGLEGNLADLTRQVFEADNRRLQGVYDLALAMGLGEQSVPSFRATDGFPPLVAAPDRETILRVATRDRSDLAAARETVASAAAQLEGAEKNTQPALDLSASVGYAGAYDRDGVDAFFAAASRNVPGVNAGVALSLELPVTNAARVGDRDRRLAQHEQATITARDLARQLPIAAQGALDDLRLSRNALEASTESVKQFEQAVADQRDKLHEGVGTVIDLVLTEQLRINAELGRTANQLRCASALARLYLTMGSLPSTEGNAAAVLGRLFTAGGANGGQ
jgi:outer membrane protein TolC